MGDGEGSWEGSADVTDMHAYPHLREASDSARRADLEHFSQSAHHTLRASHFSSHTKSRCSCCETSALRLRSQALQLCDELNERGNQFRADEVEGSLLGLARHSCPIRRPHSCMLSGRMIYVRMPLLAWRSYTSNSRPLKRRC